MCQCPTLYLNRWTRTVEGATKTPLSLEETCNWLSESKRSGHQLRLPGPQVPSLSLLRHRTLQLIRNMIKAELVTEPQEQQQQDVVVDAMREDDFDYDGERRHQDEAEEINSGIHQSESSGHSHDTNDEDDGD